MLRAIANVSQNEPGVVKHWFESDFFDLYLWQRGDQFIGLTAVVEEMAPM